MTVLPAADAPIPIFTTLKDVYGSLATAAKHAERWDELVREFEIKFGHKPTYVARAPGRVNLIGIMISLSFPMLSYGMQVNT
jgi:hypothetical protein